MCTTRDGDRTDLHDVPVRERVEGVLRPGGGMDRDRQAVLEREAAVSGEVVGMGVRLEDAGDPQAGVPGRLEVRLDRERRIDDDGHAGGGVADEVGGAPQVLVDELPEDRHEKGRPSLRAITIRCTSFVPSPISRIFWSR